MMIVLPKWYNEAEKKLNNVIDDIIRKNKIDWKFAHDSLSIDDAKEVILNSLVTIYENVGVKAREEMIEFEKWSKKKLK